MGIYNSLQLREVFHLEFLRWLGRSVKSEAYAVKGGVNLRLFFRSFRYSEDMPNGEDKDINNSGVVAWSEDRVSRVRYMLELQVKF